MLEKKKKWYSSRDLCQIFLNHLDERKLRAEGFRFVEKNSVGRWHGHWEKCSEEFDVFILLWVYGDRAGHPTQARTNNVRMLNRYIVNRTGPQPEEIDISDDDNYIAVVKAMSSDWDENALQFKLLELLKGIRRSSVANVCFLTDQELAPLYGAMHFMVKRDLETLELEGKIRIIKDDSGRRIEVIS